MDETCEEQPNQACKDTDQRTHEKLVPVSLVPPEESERKRRECERHRQIGRTVTDLLGKQE